VKNDDLLSAARGLTAVLWTRIPAKAGIETTAAVLRSGLTLAELC
jgi:hypothetical protein